MKKPDQVQKFYIIYAKMHKYNMLDIDKTYNI